MRIIANEQEFIDFFVNNDLAIIKYHSDNDCPDCLRVLPIYEKLSKDPRYEHVKFACMNADNNPNAQMLIQNRKLPFAAAYKNGLLVHGGTVASAQDLETILDTLPHININF